MLPSTTTTINKRRCTQIETIPTELQVHERSTSRDGIQSTPIKPRADSNPNTNTNQSRHSDPQDDKHADVKSTESANLRTVFRVAQMATSWKNMKSKKHDKKKAHKLLENTYRMAPDPVEKFRYEKVRNMIEETVNAFWATFEYSPSRAGPLTKVLTEEIHNRAVDMEFKRYKIVCNVILMQNRSQGVEVASRCMWTTETDSFASYTFRNGKLVCIVNVHGVYFE